MDTSNLKRAGYEPPRSSFDPFWIRGIWWRSPIKNTGVNKPPILTAYPIPITCRFLRGFLLISPLLFFLTSADARMEKFSYVNSNARQVFWAGEFNQWDTKKTPMKRDENGAWVVEIPLPNGQHPYKFVVDGNWIADPAATESEEGGYGNSIMW